MNWMRLLLMVTMVTAERDCMMSNQCEDCLQNKQCIYIQTSVRFECVEKATMHKHKPVRSYRLKAACVHVHGKTTRVESTQTILSTMTPKVDGQVNAHPTTATVTNLHDLIDPTNKPNYSDVNETSTMTFLDYNDTTESLVPIMESAAYLSPFNRDETGPPKEKIEITQVKPTEIATDHTTTNSKTTRIIGGYPTVKTWNQPKQTGSDDAPKHIDPVATQLPTDPAPSQVYNSGEDAASAPELIIANTSRSDNMHDVISALPSRSGVLFSKVTPQTPWTCALNCTEALEAKAERSLCRSHTLLNRYFKSSSQIEMQTWNMMNPSVEKRLYCMFLRFRRHHCCRKNKH